MAAEEITRMRLPWVTATFVLLAIVIHYSPDLSQRLIFDRTQILAGEWWRIPMSLLVHYSFLHLFWNMVAFFVLGAILELENRSALLWLLVLAAIGNSSFLLDTGIQLFAGASGLVMAIAGYYCILKMIKTELKLLWGILFVILLAKVGYEFISGAALFAGGGFRVLPEAHLLGLASALLLFFLVMQPGKKS